MKSFSPLFFVSSSPTSSSSSELTSYRDFHKCRVCDRPAHGFHHGALTCRACCAFFRRAGGTRNHWKCRNQNNCEAKDELASCKKCRLQKCFKIGMTVERFQIDKNNSKSPIMELPTSLEKFIGRPHVIIQCEPKSSHLKIRTNFVNLSGLVEKGSKILLNTHSRSSSELERMNSIQKLARQFNGLKFRKQHGDVIFSKIGREEVVMFWEHDFCRTAEFLAQFDEFQELPFNLKMNFLKTIWITWTMLEKVVLTAERFSKEEYPSIIAVDNSASIDTLNLEMDVSWCTEYDQDKVRYFTDMYQNCMELKGVADLLVDMKPTDFEIVFLLLQASFSYAGRRHQGEILEISERLLETISNQMHDYYSNVLRMRNYAGRIATLMKCDRIMQASILSRKQKSEIAQTFDIFNLQFSHPEMFVDSGY